MTRTYLMKISVDAHYISSILYAVSSDFCQFSATSALTLMENVDFLGVV